MQLPTHFDLLELLLIGLAFIYVWRTTRTLDVRQNISAIEAVMNRSIADLRVRQDAMAHELGRVPTQREHTDLISKLARMEAQQESMARELHAARQSQARVEDFLLNMGRKSHDE